MIAIIDYGAGNLRSVQKALEFLGHEAVVTNESSEISGADKVVLPGVGAFGDCMASLKSLGLDSCIYDAIGAGKPFLGICLGLQLLFESSEESPGVAGLGVFKGKNVKIPPSEGLKIPHMGWNSIKFDPGCPLFEGFAPGSEPYMYFVHSYYMQPENKEIISAVTNYSAELPIALHKDNVFALQFHPEKSGDDGLKILNNFAKL